MSSLPQYRHNHHQQQRPRPHPSHGGGHGRRLSEPPPQEPHEHEQEQQEYEYAQEQGHYHESGGEEEEEEEQQLGAPRATLLDLVRAQQSLDLKKLEAEQSHKEQQEALDTVVRELEAARAALQRVQAQNKEDEEVSE